MLDYNIYNTSFLEKRLLATIYGSGAKQLPRLS